METFKTKYMKLCEEEQSRRQIESFTEIKKKLDAEVEKKEVVWAALTLTEIRRKKRHKDDAT